MVSPIDKNGGEIPAPGGVFDGGVFQAAADGNSVTYSSAASFPTSTSGAPPGSQYFAARGVGGWSTANLDVPTFSGSYGPEPDGVPYQLFTGDLSRGLLLNGRPCRSVEAPCPVANFPLTGTDAPAGYQNYYLRTGGGFEALVGAGDVANSGLGPAHFALRLAGMSPDLSHVVLESCAALTSAATEIPLGEGCDPAETNLYEWSAGTLTLVNTAPGARLAASGGAVSTTGRVYFTAEPSPGERNLYLREGLQVKQVDGAVGGGGTFETAGSDGAVAFFTKAGDLWIYEAVSGTAAPLTSSGNVLGVLGASAAGASLYYVAADGLYRWSAGTTIKVSTVGGTVPTDASNFPPATGTARVSADGFTLVLVSTASLTGYDNTDRVTGLPDSEVFLYDGRANQLRCVSCRPNGTKPIGPAAIPGASRNGRLSTDVAAYKPRALSADGRRVFFNSVDAPVGLDTNVDSDVYQWEAKGSGDCVKTAGCIELISSGRAEEGADFVDASGSGDDVFFVTDESLVGTDPGSPDLYDARVGGGFPEPQPPINCLGDACQNLPSQPVDPALGTLADGLGNPKVHYFKYRRRAGGCRGAAKKRAKCKKPGHHKSRHGGAKGKKGGRR